MGIRHARLAAALLTTTALGLGAMEIQANLSARAELQHLIEKHPGFAVASIFAEPLTGRLLLRDVTAGYGTTRVTIGALNLPLPHQSLGLIAPAAASPFDDKEEDAKPEGGKVDEAKPEGGKADDATSEGGKADDASPDEAKPQAPAAAAAPAGAPGAASAEDVTITHGTTTYRIKHIDLAGTNLSNADLAGLLDSKSGDSLEARLRKLTAASVTAPEIVIDDTSDGGVRHATLTQVVLAGATGGKVTSGSAGGVVLTNKDADDDVTATTGAIQASNIDLAQIAHAFGTIRSDDAEPILPLYDSVSITAIKVTNLKKNSTLTVAALKETGAKARALKTDIFADRGKTKLSKEQQKAEFDDLSHSIEIGTIEATDIAGQNKDKDKEKGTDTFSIASVAMKDFAQAKIGGFALRTLRFDGPGVKFGLGSVDIGPFALPPPKDAAASKDPNKQDPGLMVSPAKMDISDLDVDVDTTDKDKGGPPSNAKFKVAKIGFVSDGIAGDIPKTSKLDVENVTLDLTPVEGAGTAKPLYDMGYRHLDLSMGLSTTYEAATQTLAIQNLTLQGVDMGSVALGLKLVNVTKGVISSNEEVMKASALAILVKGLTLDVKNDGLAQKALERQAKQDGVTVDKEREGLIDFFANKLPASVNNSANVKLVGSAIAKFVADPKTLHIGIESKSGLGIGSMALLSDPGLLIDALDVKASANQ